MFKKQVVRVSFYCSLLYFASYLTRLGFAAALVEIVADLGIERSRASLATTGLFIFYGCGQFLSGWLGDRIKPRNLMLGGMLGSAICNIAVAFTSSVPVMVTVWCFNGLMQAFLWPPMTRLMSDTLDDREYMIANKWASSCANCGTIVVYALMSLFAKFFSWRTYFITASVFGVFASVVSYIGLGKAKKIEREVVASVKKADESTGTVHMSLGRLVLVSALPLIMLAIVMQGMLRDGVVTWMPSLIADTANMGSAASILSTAILPLFGVLCINLAAEIQKRVPNDLLSSGALFIAAAVCSAVILPLLGNCTIAVIFLMAVITGCAHAINFLLICHVPSYFAKYNKVSTVSGLINSCTYVGSALSTYGIALLSERFGWYFTVGVWCAVAAAGALLCAAAMPGWKRFAGIKGK